MKKNIIVNIYGGLGNQMFQYAAGRALSLRLQVPLYLNIEWFSHKQNPAWTRIFELDIFDNITAPKLKRSSFPCSAIIRRIKHYLSFSHTTQEPHFSYWPGFFEISPPTILNSYWQSEKYVSIQS